MSNEEALSEALSEVLLRYCGRHDARDYTTDSVLQMLFELESGYWYYMDVLRPADQRLPRYASFKEFLTRFMQQYRDLLHGDPAELCRLFDEYKSTISRCGAVILDDTFKYTLLVRPPKGDRWHFPRGKLWRGETQRECALREVREETGLDATAYMTDDCVHGSFKGTPIDLFVVVGVSRETVLKPSNAKEIGSISWHSLDLIYFMYKAGGADRIQYGPIMPYMEQIRSWVEKHRHMPLPLAQHTVKSAPLLPPAASTNINTTITNALSHNNSTVFSNGTVRGNAETLNYDANHEPAEGWIHSTSHDSAEVVKGWSHTRTDAVVDDTFGARHDAPHLALNRQPMGGFHFNVDLVLQEW